MTASASRCFAISLPRASRKRSWAAVSSVPVLVRFVVMWPWPAVKRGVSYGVPYARPGLADHLTRCALGEDALQRAAVHVEAAGGFADVVAAEFVDALNVLPTDTIGGHRIVRRLGRGVWRREQRFDDVLGIGGLGEIVDGTGL